MFATFSHITTNYLRAVDIDGLVSRAFIFQGLQWTELNLASLTHECVLLLAIL